MAGRERPRLVLLAALFVLSGAASLMDQVVWLRYLSLTFGNTTYAAATLLAVFLGGLGLGALACGRLADRLRRPLTLYAAAEVGIALAAIASPRMFDLIDRGYVHVFRTLGHDPAAFAVARALLAALFLLPPTLLMGGTLPLMLRAAARGAGTAGSLTSLLYGANTLGAMGGVAFAGFLTIRLIGLYGTLLIAAGFNLVIALGMLALGSEPVGSLRTRLRVRPSACQTRPEGPDRPTPERGPAAQETPPGAAPTGRARTWLLLLFFLMGATSLAYEVLWTRVLVFYLGSSVYAFSLVLLLVLLGLGAGSLLARPWVDRLRSPLRALAVLEAGIAVAALAQIWLFQSLNASLVAWATWLAPQSSAGLTLVKLAALAPVLGPPTLLMGLSFPVAVRAVNREAAALGTDVGAVYGWNTLGSVAGSLATGFGLIPLLGTQSSLVVIAAANALLAALAWIARPAPGARRARLLAATAPAAILAAIPLLPADRLILAAGMFRHDQPEDLVYFHEDASATVTIRRLPSPRGPYLSLELNGVNVAGTSPDLFAVQKMQGHLPMLLADSPRTVAHIGFGSGGTAHAVSLYPLAEILVVEISPEVLRASDRVFGAINHGVLADPRIRIEVNDGRNYLLATERRFDAVLSDSIHPRYAGNGSLYSLEYFRLVRERLEPGGTVSMWLPMYSLTPDNYAMILKAFVEVFPDAAVWYEPSALNSFTIVTGKAGPGAWTPSSLARAFADPRISAELAEIGIAGPADVLACYLLGGEELGRWLAEVPPHTDDLPAVEYDSGALIESEPSWVATFGALLARRAPEPPAEYLAALPPAERERARQVYTAHGRRMEEHRRFLVRQVHGRSE